MSTLTLPDLDLGAAPAAVSQDAASLRELLAKLYSLEIREGPNDCDRNYLRKHSVPDFIADQIATFHWYRPYLPASGTLLDFGCRQAPDSCLMRATFGDRYALHGCDLWRPGLFPFFHDYAGLNYSQLTDSFELPYDDNTFDVVVAGGVLEHVALEYEALRQLYRVITPGGKLIIHYLPNRWSIHEWYLRRFLKKGHRRLYGLGATRETLKRTGFWPLASGYHDIHFWDKRLRFLGTGPWVVSLRRTLTRVLPFRLLCPTIRFVAEKVSHM